MKKHLFLLLLIYISGLAYSQDRIAYGIVNNIRTKEPIQNALVEVANTNRQVFTDSLGNFTIEVPKGSHHLLISHSNFLSDDRYLKAPFWNKPLHIGLMDSIWLLNDEAKNKEQILTSEYEFSKCYRKKRGISYIDKDFAVFFVLTKNGDTIEFNKNNPGRILDTGVFGIPMIRLAFSDIDSTVFSKQSMESIWKNGIKYQFIAQYLSGYLCYQSEEINIPLSDIEMLKLKVQDNEKIVGVTIIVAGAAAGIVGIILILKPICNNDCVITI